VKYAWIDAQRGAFDLTELCAVLGVSISGYRAWQRGGTPRRRRLTDAPLLALIRSIHAELRGAYGSPRLLCELRGRGFPASKARVERLMRENGIRARHKRRYKATTDSSHGLPVATNVLDRQFTPSAPNQVWSSDITYLWTDAGWQYLAITLDLFNREVVGWALKPRLTADLATDALTMAWFRRRPAPGVLHHSDRGSQYASRAFQDRLTAYGMACSMSRKGNCWTTPRPRAGSTASRTSASTGTAMQHVLRSRGDLRLHRGLLQSQTPPFQSRLPVAGAVPGALAHDRGRTEAVA